MSLLYGISGVGFKIISDLKIAALIVVQKFSVVNSTPESRLQ